MKTRGVAGLLLTLCFARVHAQAQALSIHHVPIPNADEGQDVPIQATLSGPNPAASAYLFFRQAGQGNFLPVRMALSGSQASAVIPGSQVTPAGVDYFLQATDAQNATATFPSASPQAAPLRISVAPASGPFEILPAYPQPDQEVGEDRPALQARFTRGQGGLDPESARLFVDAVDVTAEARITRTELLWTPGRPLSAGDHHVLIGAKSRSGLWGVPLSFRFKVSAAAVRRPFFTAHGTLSLEPAFVDVRQRPLDDRLLALPTTKSGFIPAFSLEAAGSLGSRSHTVSVFHSPIDRGEQPSPSRYLAQLAGPSWQAALGDSTLNLSELTMSYQRLRGASLDYSLPGAWAKVTALGGQSRRAVETSRFGTGTFAQYLYGGRFELPRLGPFGLGATFLKGEDDAGSLANPGSATPVGNAVGSVDGTFRLPLGAELKAEAARSAYRPDLGSGREELGTAWQARLKRDGPRAGGWAQFRRADPRFVSLGNAFLQNDYEGAEANGNLRLLDNALILTGGLLFWHDNTEGQKDSTLRTLRWLAGSSWTPRPGRPTWTLGFSEQTQANGSGALTPLDNRARSWTAGASGLSGRTSYGLFYTLSQYRDRAASPLTPDTDSHSGSASLSTLSLGASLSANLGWSQTQDLATGSRTRFKSLSGKAGHPIPGLEGLSAEAAGGYSRADDDAGFLDTVQTSWSAGLQWKAGQGVLWSASYEGLRYEDAVNAGQSYDEGRATVKAVLAF